MLTEVKRTWKERLFTLPWTPFKATKKVPSKEALIFGYDTLIVHPSMLDKFKNEKELHHGQKGIFRWDMQ